MEMCWNVELFVCLIFNSSCLNLLYFWKMTRVVPWNSDFWSGVSFLKSVLSAGKCSRMHGWTLGGTNTLWFSNMFLTATFPRSFLFFIIYHTRWKVEGFCAHVSQVLPKTVFWPLLWNWYQKSSCALPVYHFYLL